MNYFEKLQKDWKTGKKPHYFSRNLPVDEYGLAAVGGRMDVDFVLEAYSKGYFPWSGEDPIPWFSPDPRMILRPEKLVVSRSFQKFIRQTSWQVRCDTSYKQVMENCSSIRREGQDGTWIDGLMIPTYTQLHELGVTHSFEVFEEEQLVGGLYGLTLGNMFFGESMFSKKPNASKLALYFLCQTALKHKIKFIDCQQETPHLKSLGASPISRKQFQKELQEGLQHPSLHFRWELPSNQEREEKDAKRS